MEEDKTIGKEIQLPCLRCDTETYHKVLKSIDEVEQGDWGAYGESHQIVACLGCRTVSFRKEWGTDAIVGVDDDGKPEYESNEELYPSRVAGRKRIDHAYELPSGMRQVYEETHKAVCGKQPILAGIGIRAIVETVCKDKEAKGNSLQAKIDGLVELGVLTKEGAEILHQTRLYGNDSAHEANPISERNLGLLMDIAENLLVNVYVLPKRAVALREEKAAGDAKRKT